MVSENLGVTWGQHQWASVMNVVVFRVRQGIQETRMYKRSTVNDW
jgi:hypothetical protein